MINSFTYRHHDRHSSNFSLTYKPLQLWKETGVSKKDEGGCLNKFKLASKHGFEIVAKVQ